MNKFKKIILNNNIPLYLCIDPSMKNTFVSYNVNYGSSGLWFNFNNRGKDYKVTSGYAHYLEHLLGEHSMFGNMYENFDRRMQNANAYTSQNHTSYHFKGLKDIEKSIEELIMSIDSPVFESKDVEATRHAIEEEASSYCDNPGVLLVDMVDNNLYRGFDKFDSTYSPIGNRQTTRDITLEDLRNCYDAFYSDDKKYLVIAGNVDEKRIVDLLNNIYSKIKPHKSTLVMPSIDFSGIKEKDATVYRDVDTPISSLGVKVRKPDYLSMKEFNYCMNIIKKYLFNSRAYNNLNKSGIVDSFEYGYLTNVGDYINFIQSFTTSKKEECCKRLYELLSKKEITAKEYDLAKKELIASEIRNMEKKYNYVENFPGRLYYTQDYSDSEFYRSIDYEEFMSSISSFDFSEYTIGEVKRLSRVKK